MRVLSPVLALASVLAVIGVGCGGSDAPPVRPALEYFPLAQGNWWRYEVTDYTVTEAAKVAVMRAHRRLMMGMLYGPARVRTAQEGPGVSILTVSISGIRVINETAWYEAVTVQTGLDTETAYFRHDSDGLLFRATADDDPYYRIRQPIETGNMWHPSFDESWQIQIMAVDETVETPAGTLSGCLRVEESGMWDTVSYRGVGWFAPKIGLVRTEDYFDGELAVKSELTEYHVGG